MTDTWDGRPQNPERDGWHWLLERYRWCRPEAVEWCSEPGVWRGKGPASAAVGQEVRYLGPCLTPAEVEAEKILAREEGRIAGFEEAMDDLRDAPPLGVNRHGVMYLSPPEVEARVAAARREGIEAAAEIAKQFAIHQGDAYDIVAAIRTKLLTEGGR